MHYKSFPQTIEGTNMPVWREIDLSHEEEFSEEQKARREYATLMKVCFDDAKRLLEERGMPEYQSDVVNIALTLFRKRASHVTYWKDNKCREKFISLLRGAPVKQQAAKTQRKEQAVKQKVALKPIAV